MDTPFEGKHQEQPLHMHHIAADAKIDLASICSIRRISEQPHFMQQLHMLFIVIFGSSYERKLQMTGMKGKIALVLRILTGLFFLAAAIAKLVGARQMVYEFDQVGFGQWLRYATGLAELVGVGLLIRARTVSSGAAILIAVCAGAAYAQLTALHEGIMHLAIIATVLGWIAWVYRRANRTFAVA